MDCTISRTFPHFCDGFNPWATTFMDVIFQNMFPWRHPGALYSVLVCYLVHRCTDFPLLGAACSSVPSIDPYWEISTNIPRSFLLPCSLPSLVVSSPSSRDPPTSVVAFPFFTFITILSLIPRLHNILVHKCHSIIMFCSGDSLSFTSITNVNLWTGWWRCCSADSVSKCVDTTDKSKVSRTEVYTLQYVMYID